MYINKYHQNVHHKNYSNKFHLIVSVFVRHFNIYLASKNEEKYHKNNK